MSLEENAIDILRDRFQTINEYAQLSGRERFSNEYEQGYYSRDKRLQRLLDALMKKTSLTEDQITRIREVIRSNSNSLMFRDYAGFFEGRQKSKVEQNIPKLNLQRFRSFGMAIELSPICSSFFKEVFELEMRLIEATYTPNKETLNALEQIIVGYSDEFHDHKTELKEKLGQIKNNHEELIQLEKTHYDDFIKKVKNYKRVNGFLINLKIVKKICRTVSTEIGKSRKENDRTASSSFEEIKSLTGFINDIFLLYTGTMVSFKCSQIKNYIYR